MALIGQFVGGPKWEEYAASRLHQMARRPISVHLARDVGWRRVTRDLENHARSALRNQCSSRFDDGVDGARERSRARALDIDIWKVKASFLVLKEIWLARNKLIYSRIYNLCFCAKSTPNKPYLINLNHNRVVSEEESDYGEEVSEGRVRRTRGRGVESGNTELKKKGSSPPPLLSQVKWCQGQRNLMNLWGPPHENQWNNFVHMSRET